MIRIFVTFIAASVGLLLVIPVVSFFIPYWIFSASVNSLNKLIARRGHSWKEILRFEPEIGWKPRSGLNVTYYDRIGDKCSISTDSEGWIGDHAIAKCDVVVFGDSFAFGYGSAFRDAYFSNMDGIRVKAVAAPGYSMVQEFLLMKRYSQSLKGKLVVWLVCIENDLVENLGAYKPKFGYTTPYLRDVNGSGVWQIEYSHVDEKRWEFGDEGTNNRILFAHLCRNSSEYSNRIFSAAEHLVREAKQVCDNAGAELVFFSIPYKQQLSKLGVLRLQGALANADAFDPDYPDRKLRRICETYSVPYIRGAEFLSISDYKVRDGHWNRSGNEKVARILAEQLKKERSSMIPGYEMPDLCEQRSEDIYHRTN